MNKLFILLTLLLANLAVGQELLDAKTAIEITLANNLDIQISNNDLQVAKNNASIYNSGFLPTLSGSGNANFNNNIKQTTNFEDGTTNEVENVPSDSYSASLDLNVTLFDGLGRKYNYKSLQETYNVTELQARETIETTVLNLFSVYYEVARLSENKSILETTLGISKERLTRAQYQFEYGQGSKLDFLNAQVDVNTDSINLLNANLELANTKRDLNLVMNRDLETAFAIDTSILFIPNLRMTEIYGMAKANNVTILQAEGNLLVSRYDLKSSKSGFLPTVGLTGSYGWNQTINDPNAPVIFFLDQSTVSGSIGANLTWNIFDGGTTMTNVNNSKVNYRTQQLRINQTKLQVERDIKNAWESYKNTLYVLEAQNKNVITNANNLERTEEQYKLGLTTSVEFRQAQTNYLNAVLSKNQAKYDAKNAELLVLQLSGQLLNTDF